METPPPAPDIPPPGLHARIAGLFASDPFSAPLAIRLVDTGKGRAHLSMRMEAAHLNAHGSGHGGALWTLADMAFGAAGYYEGPILTAGSDLTFIRPAAAGATIHAMARQVSRKGRTAVFQIVLAADPDDPETVVAAGTFAGRWAKAPRSDPALPADRSPID